MGYLALDRPTSSLSTGERQRTQMARAVRNRTTGVLYVLDEPSIGLHPSNIEGLICIMDALVDDGNSIVLVDHDTQILSRSDWIVELGPGSGSGGGTVIAAGTVEDIRRDPRSRIGPFLSGEPAAPPGTVCGDMFEHGSICMETSRIHTVKPLSVRIPRGRLTAVTGMSGSGKTTMVLESLVPALQASLQGGDLPPHVVSVDPGGITQVNLIDASPIGINIRSTVATYSGVHDELRRLFAKASGLKTGDFSYNTGKLRCPTCDGTG